MRPKALKLLFSELPLTTVENNSFMLLGHLKWRLLELYCLWHLVGTQKIFWLNLVMNF